MQNPVLLDGRAYDWLTGGDVGTSSLTIFAVMTGADRVPLHNYPSVPLDPADFGRCRRLLERIPEWRARLPEVATRYPDWTALVREWDRLDAMHAEASKRPDGMAREMYHLMKRLIDEGRGDRAGRPL
jgi:hypothetical protein